MNETIINIVVFILGAIVGRKIHAWAMKSKLERLGLFNKQESKHKEDLR